jgi:hypothetical protein
MGIGKTTSVGSIVPIRTLILRVHTCKSLLLKCRENYFSAEFAAQNMCFINKR